MSEYSFDITMFHFFERDGFQYRCNSDASRVERHVMDNKWARTYSCELQDAARKSIREWADAMLAKSSRYAEIERCLKRAADSENREAYFWDTVSK